MGKSLKRRSPMILRKEEIRVLHNDRPLPASPSQRGTFTAANDIGSGSDSDLYYQRLMAWKNIIENHLEYFKNMAAAEMDLATVYARIGDIIQIPVRESPLFLTPPSTITDNSARPSFDSVQWVAYRLKQHQQSMVETHYMISNEIKSIAVTDLENLRKGVEQMIAGYVSAVAPVFDELVQCKRRIKDRVALLETTLDYTVQSTNKSCSGDLRKEVIKDPFIINLEVEALLRKQAELENDLYGAVGVQQARIREFELELIEGIKSVANRYLTERGSGIKSLRQSLKQYVCENAQIDPLGEWAHFNDTYNTILSAPQAIHGESKAVDIEYAGKRSKWVKVVRQGVVALKEHGPLFRSTWQSKYTILTARGYFHVFRSQGDVTTGAPETSIFLPRARVSIIRAGTLQIRTGNKFSQTKIVIQDGPSSLDNWRLLMESIKSQIMGRDDPNTIPTGIATPPDSGSSSDDSSGFGCVDRQKESSHQTLNSRKHEGNSSSITNPKRHSIAVSQVATSDLALSLKSTRRKTHTTKRLRPLSSTSSNHNLDSPSGFPKNHIIGGTPTHGSLYLHPLEGTPQRFSYNARSNYQSPQPPHLLSQFSHISPLMNMNEMSFDGIPSIASPVGTPTKQQKQKEGDQKHFDFYSDQQKYSPYSGASNTSIPAEVSGCTDINIVDTCTTSDSSSVPDGTINSSLLGHQRSSEETEQFSLASLPKLARRRNAGGLGHASHMSGIEIAVPDTEFTTPWAPTQFGCHPTQVQRQTASGSKVQDSRAHHQHSSSLGYVPGQNSSHGYSDDEIWDSDLLSIPDPEIRTNNRPRSLIQQPTADIFDTVNNPYLDDYILKVSGIQSFTAAAPLSDTQLRRSRQSQWREITSTTVGYRAHSQPCMSPALPSFQPSFQGTADCEKNRWLETGPCRSPASSFSQ